MNTDLPYITQNHSSKTHPQNKAEVMKFRFATPLMKFVLLIADILSLYLGGFAAYKFRVALGGINNSDLYIPMLLLPFLFVTVFAWRSLYRPIGMGAVEELRRLLITNSLMFLLLSSVTFLLKSPPVFSRLMFGFAWILTSLALPLTRMLLRNLSSSLNIWGAPALVVFSNNVPVTHADMESTYREQMVRGLKPLLFFREDDTLKRENLVQILSMNRVKFCLVFFNELNEVEHLRKQYKTMFERIIFIRYQSDGLDFSNLHISHLGGAIGLEFHQRLLSNSAHLQKRAMDLVISTMLLLILSPLFLLLSLAIVIDSKGGAFFSQSRIGKNSKTFKMIKFRTMHKDAEDYLVKYLDSNPEAKLEWDCFQKLSNDPRLSRVGNFLRKTSLDELPQLLNVFLGQMSLVGPRPFMTDQQEAYGEAFSFYVSVPPGMTGLWQVSGRNKTSFARRAVLDVRYVKSWSVWLDIYILARTVWVLLTRDGAC